MKLTPEIVQSRIDAAGRVYDRVKARHREIEDSLRGVFPMMTSTRNGVDPRTQKLGVDQIEVNLNLQATQHMLSHWDEFPSLKFSRAPFVTQDLVARVTSAVERAMDEGTASEECREGMLSAMARGPIVVWFGVGGGLPNGSRLRGMSTSPGAIAAAAALGQPVTLLPGMDFESIANALRQALADPHQVARLPLQVQAQMVSLAQECDRLLEKERRSPTWALEDPRSIWYDHTPYGSRMRWDATVTRHTKIRWASRLLVYTPEEFGSCEAFTDKAKREAKPVTLGPESEVESTGAPEDAVAYRIWEYWDVVERSLHYKAEGYDQFLEKDPSYPYEGPDGRSIFPRFFPFVARVPIRHPREVPEGSIGVAQLDPGWGHQVEAIKMSTYGLNAQKRTARVFLVGAGIDTAQFADLETARDGTILRAKAGATKEESQADLMPFNAPAPADYLLARQRIMFDYASAVRVPAIAFTGEPTADTLGQEQMAVQGASASQGDIVRQYESLWAELGDCTLLAMRQFFSNEQMQAYLGPDAVQPRVQMVLDPTTGVPTQVELPSLWDEFKSAPLDGCRFTARFATSTRAEDLATVKMAQDYLSLLLTARDATGTPLRDPGEAIDRIAKLMDQPPPGPYKPTPAETAAMAAGGAPDGPDAQGGDREAPGGGREDGRRAGGERGPPAVPGRQSRDRAPQTRSQMNGVANRAQTARA